MCLHLSTQTWMSVRTLLSVIAPLTPSVTTPRPPTTAPVATATQTFFPKMLVHRVKVCWRGAALSVNGRT